MRSTVTIYSWNVNGIRAVLKKDVFKPFIKKHRPDILCLQETKANREQVAIDLPEYEEYWCSADRKGYAGTAMFVRSDYADRPLAAFYGLPEDIVSKYQLADTYGDTSTEGRVLALEFKSYYVVTVYTPNAKEDLSRIPMRQQWDPAFLTYIKALESKKPVIFCGDLNVAHTPDDLARPKENEGNKGFTKEERTGFDALVSAGFIDTFREFHKGNGHYTWWSHWANARERNVGWRIDYVLISPKLKTKLKKAKIHPEVWGSDHCPVSIELDI